MATIKGYIALVVAAFRITAGSPHEGSFRVTKAGDFRVRKV